MRAVDLIALTLAIGGAVDCWLNGSIFAGLRARARGRALLACDYCLNWHVPLWLIALSYLPSLWLPPPWDVAARLPIYWLAAAYGAWLINEWRATRECDYRRTARADEAMAAYGGDRADGGTPDPGHPGWGPALAFADGGELHYYCSSECRHEAATAYYNRGIACREYETAAAAGARCATCDKVIS